MKKVFITTSIPYVNAEPHIGFALELVQGDAIARYYRDKLGKDLPATRLSSSKSGRQGQVFFLNGTDEHGSKIEKKAKEAGVEPQKFVDQISRKFIDLGKALNISNDDFIRTTSDRHKKSASKLWELCQKDIYKKNYKGLYCLGCECFITEKELVDGLCPIHKTKPELVEEENYFFALSKYADRLKALIQSDKLKITPELRKNEVLSWLKEGVQDISISREKSKLGWGIPVPGDENQVMYVWVDALSNYITGAGFPDHYLDWWNEETLKIHVIGKDILRFHAIIWPGLLLSAGLPLPNIIYAHGHITSNNQKMSKSLGNVVDPFLLIKKYGADAVRYFLLAKIPWDGDGDFSLEKFQAVYKGELSDNWGNLLNRLVVLGKKAGINIKEWIPDPIRQSQGVSGIEPQVRDDKKVGGDDKLQIGDDNPELEGFQFNQYIEKQIGELAKINREINEIEPWNLIKSDAVKAKEIIGKWLSNYYRISQQLSFIAPETYDKIEETFGSGEAGQLFPRVE